MEPFDAESFVLPVARAIRSKCVSGEVTERKIPIEQLPNREVSYNRTRAENIAAKRDFHMYMYFREDLESVLRRITDARFHS